MTLISTKIYNNLRIIGKLGFSKNKIFGGEFTDEYVWASSHEEFMVISMLWLCDNFMFSLILVFFVYIYGVLLYSNISIRLFTRDEPVLLLCFIDFISIIAITKNNR